MIYSLIRKSRLMMSEKFFPKINSLDAKILERVMIDSKYSKYIRRQEEDIALFKKHGEMKVPQNIDEIQSLSMEVREKIKSIKPKTIAELSRISGVTPASIVAIIIFNKNKVQTEA